MKNWDFWVDRGGTFTDIVAKTPNGNIVTHKLLSENPEVYKDSLLQGIRDLMGIGKTTLIPASKIASVKIGTTVATNALLERKGEKTVLLTTKGFRDALKIGYQARKEIFAKEIKKLEQLYSHVIEINERLRVEGTIEKPLDISEVETALLALYQGGYRSIAIVFMHAYAYPDHELLAEKIAAKIGFTQISVSHKVSPLMKFIGRGHTTVVDGYLTPILSHYIAKVTGEFCGLENARTKFMFMTSNGGLTFADGFQGKDAIFSGPAGGVVGAVKTSKLAGFNKIIGFDMGGTSTDVSHYNGVFERSFETEVAGVHIRAPMMNIHTVAAGGGSVLHYDGLKFSVGPDSAGANPGPASYLRGGPLTVTDANVMLGKLKPENFPKIFGPNQDKYLDAGVVEEKFKELAQEIGHGKNVYDVAEGFLSIAVENMASAIKKISVQRGYDVSDYALTCFGGASGQHACLVADSLAMETIYIHSYSGVLSAYGIGLGDVQRSRSASVAKFLNEGLLVDIKPLFDSFKAENEADLIKQGVADPRTVKRLHLCYDGTNTTLAIDVSTISQMTFDFTKLHKQRFGLVFENKKIFVESLEVESFGGAMDIETITLPDTVSKLNSHETTSIYINGEWHKAKVYKARKGFKSGLKINGPALIVESHQTIVVEPHWQALVTKQNDIVLQRIKPKKIKYAVGTKADPIFLEVFNNLFMSIAEEMGFTLQNTSHSVNIKERLDFSCAVFAANGSLVANAPHMPVHLGSMDRSVETILKLNKGDIYPGDVFALNTPYNGGTHLPDITVVTPVFDDVEKKVIFYTASRGHHGDVGGTTPGSMTPFAVTVEEEGVLMDNFRIVRKGVFQENALYTLLTDHPFPCRNPMQNIADLRAQVAANEMGIGQLRKVIDQFGLHTVQSYMKHVQNNAEENVRRVISALHDSCYSYKTDQGSIIKVKISVNKEKRTATVDFTGTSAQQENNFNAPEPVARAAVLYAFRIMVEENIPINAGCLRPINIIIPNGCMLKPSYPAAVVAGNVETSQHITNTLFGALGVMANSQGTMNNFTFGNDTYQYYETICSGSPAGNGFNGTDAVQVHMTNSSMTDPEILEFRYPVLLENFFIRKGSGGLGKWSAGDGTERTLRFLESMEMTILSSHRQRPPEGLCGGGSGEVGQAFVRRLNGEVEILPGCAHTTLKAGETVTIKTPTAGGYG